MAAPSMFGGTRGWNAYNSSLAITNSGFIVSNRTSVDYTINVGITGASNSTIKNNTGQTVTVDVFGGWHGRTTGGNFVQFAVMKSTDNGSTWSETTGTIRANSNVTNTFYNSHMTNGVVELADGDMIAMGYKCGGASDTMTINGEWIFCVSRDGNNNPAMQGVCSTQLHDALYVNGTTSLNAWKQITPSTVVGAQNVGLTSGTAGRMVNDTGAAQTFFCITHMSVGQYNGTNQTTIEYNTALSGGSGEGYTVNANSDGSPFYYTTIILPLMGSLNNANYPYSRARNITSAARGVQLWSYQQFLFSLET